MGRLQLHFLSAAGLAAQLSFDIASCGFAALCFLHERALVSCGIDRLADWGMAGRSI